ncbi:hypothetical protein QQP08_022133 [Theobroma cacao]|nr:hypothetical protein QQP08_022133 [Theobroma cacao]
MANIDNMVCTRVSTRNKIAAIVEAFLQDVLKSYALMLLSCCAKAARSLHSALHIKESIVGHSVLNLIMFVQSLLNEEATPPPSPSHCLIVVFSSGKSASLLVWNEVIH